VQQIVRLSPEVRNYFLILARPVYGSPGISKLRAIGVRSGPTALNFNAVFDLFEILLKFGAPTKSYHLV
jgi:hypothetical protein